MGAYNCPDDPTETAEAFVMRRMDPGETSLYLEHLAHCQTCAEIAQMTQDFVQAMRDAASGFSDGDDGKPN